MNAASAIYLREDLKDKLQELKHHPNESYNSVIERLLTPRGITTSSALRQSKVSRKHWVISGNTSWFSKRGYDGICVLNDRRVRYFVRFCYVVPFVMAIQPRTFPFTLRANSSAFLRSSAFGLPLFSPPKNRRKLFVFHPAQPNSPPEHQDKVIRKTKQEASARKEHFDGKPTEK